MGGEKRVVLGLHPALAPVKAAILPLVNNKPEISALSRQVFKTLQNRYAVEYDTSGAIGRRYRRADEAGTPYCITIDHNSLIDHSVTVRDRDSMEQTRVKVDELQAFLGERLDQF